ncbi:ribosomal-protein-serine acetyltransferase [bacterium BMS3Abin04]|nr:ribosomal-protein-serine acetyltransferase [bacterium BMS3Abin04]
MSNREIPQFKWPALETERLILRKFTYDDLNDISEYASNPEITKYVQWEAHRSKTETLEFLNIVVEMYIKHRPAPWGIELKEEKKIIGTIGFTKIFPEEFSCEVGYTLSQNYWNRGLMTEALKKILEYGFDVMDLNSIIAHCIVENEQSAKVLLKSGMNYVKTVKGNLMVKGNMVDVKLFSLSKKEFKLLKY